MPAPINGQDMRFTRTCVFACLLAAILGILQPVTARADSLWGTNLIKNPGFEEGRLVPIYWTRFRAAGQPGDDDASSILKLDDKVVRSGKKSMAMYGTPKTTYWQGAEAPPAPVTAGEVYRVSGWIKTTQVRQDGDQFANCNLIVRFIDPVGSIVNIGPSPVVATRRIMGTTDWSYVDRIIVAPEGATSARVACTLTCSGSAWFDDIAFRPRVKLNWQRKSAGSMVFLYEGADGPPDGTTEAIVAHRDAIKEALELGHNERISFFKYATQDRKTELTGISSQAHFETNQVHSVSWNDRQQLPLALVEPWGLSIPYLSNGIAVYLSGSWGNTNAHDFSRTVVQSVGLLPVKPLLDRTTFTTLDPNIVYPQAASFVGFLLEEYGPAKLKTLYPVDTPKESTTAWLHRFKNIYGKSLDEVEREWWEFLVPN